MSTTAREWVTRLTVPATVPAYRATWTFVALVAGVLASLGAVVAPDGAVAPCLFVTTWICVGALTLTIALETHASLWSSVAPALAAATGVTACYTSWVLLGFWGAVLPVVLTLTAPRLMLLALRRAGGIPLAVTGTAPTLPEMLAHRAWEDVEPADAEGYVAPTTSGDVAGLSIRCLCELWSSTSRELASRPSPRRSLALIELREACLAELWHRDELGCLRWWRAGAPAPDPGRYLSRRVAGGES